MIRQTILFQGRGKRGIYKTEKGLFINADINGAGTSTVKNIHMLMMTGTSYLYKDKRKWYPILISTLERKACVTRDILVRRISQE